EASTRIVGSALSCGIVVDDTVVQVAVIRPASADRRIADKRAVVEAGERCAAPVAVSRVAGQHAVIQGAIVGSTSAAVGRDVAHHPAIVEYARHHPATPNGRVADERAVVESSTGGSTAHVAR